MEAGRVGGRGYRFAHSPVAEHLRKFGQDLEVLFGRLLGDQERKDQAYRFAVGCIERHRRGNTQEGPQRVLETLDPSMRKGDAVAQAGGAETLAREQAVINHAPGDAVVIFEKEGEMLEQPLLARYGNVHGNVGRGKKLGDEAHGSGSQEGSAPVKGGLRGGEL